MASDRVETNGFVLHLGLTNREKMVGKMDAWLDTDLRF